MASKPTRFLGLEWAPLGTPLRRRLQTLGVIHYWYVFLFGCISSFCLVAYLLYSGYYVIIIIFIVYVYLDRNTPERGGRTWQPFRKWSLFRYGCEYFPMKLHKTVDLDPTQSYLGGFHPHGIMAVGGFFQFGSEGTGFSKLFPGIYPHILTLGGWFNFPLIRDYLMMAGVCSVSGASIDYLLTQPGHMPIVAVGGAKESLLSRPGEYKIYIKNRKGFIKRAIRRGACLLPIFSFGENDMYHQVDNPNGSRLKRFQEITTKYIGFSPPIFHGRGIFQYTFGLLPYRVPINTVVGKPISTTKFEEPTQEVIDAIHKKYVDGLVALFEENKTRFGVDKKVHLTLM